MADRGSGVPKADDLGPYRGLEVGLHPHWITVALTEIFLRWSMTALSSRLGIGALVNLFFLATAPAGRHTDGFACPVVYCLLMGFFEFLDGIWVWMTPGVDALAVVAPVGAPLVAAAAVAAAISTFRLRARVDHVDQWWKQVNFAVDKSLGTSEEEKNVGDIILSALRNPETPARPEQWSNNRLNRNFDVQLKVYKHHVKSYRKSLRRRWKISDREEQMLVDLADAFTLQAIGTPGKEDG